MKEGLPKLYNYTKVNQIIKGDIQDAIRQGSVCSSKLGKKESFTGHANIKIYNNLKISNFRIQF